MTARKGVAVESLSDAIAVFDKSAERTTPNAQTEAWAIIRKHITDYAALQRRVGELEALAKKWDAEARERNYAAPNAALRLERAANELRAILSGDGECATTEGEME